MSRHWPWLVTLLSLPTIAGWLVLGRLAMWLESLA